MSSLAVRPDPSRVFGIAIAVSVHIAAGMLLLIGDSPMWNLPQAIDEPLQTVWIRPKPTPVVPVMPVAPPKLDVVKPTPTLAPTPRISVVETVHPQPIALPVVADPVEMAAPTVVDVPAEVPVAATPSALAYAFAPPPAYPISGPTPWRSGDSLVARRGGSAGQTDRGDRAGEQWLQGT